MSKTVECACVICGKHYIAPARKVRKGKHRTCSHRCGRLANIMPAEQRFWAKVDKSSGPDACWPWLAGKVRGYGYFTNNSRTLKAYRFVYELTYGPIPEGMMICHHCNNPSCCNPAHLYAGTAATNTNDMMRAGHWNGNILPPMLGEANPKAKLTEGTVRFIRRAYAGRISTISQLAEQFSIAKNSIRAVVQRKTWRHIS